ncbi:MAG: hypothetical protein ACOCWM_02505 [Cyclobacteriaceae bacterium]
MLKRIKINPIIIAAGIIIFNLTFLVVMYKSFCRLDQVINWNAANAIASIAMAILTFIAVFVAIYLPRKERLFISKVELFDKRYEAYKMLNDFLWNLIVTGKPSVDDNNFHEIAVSRLRFLIDSEDWKKIKSLTKSIIDRIDHEVASNPNDFENELNELRIIFNKYLYFSDIDF